MAIFAVEPLPPLLTSYLSSVGELIKYSRGHVNN